MSVFYLVMAVFVGSTASIFSKIYNLQNPDGENRIEIYNFMLFVSILLGWWILYACNFSFDIRVLPYSILFSLSHIICFWGINASVKYGPAALTSLFLGLSHLIPTIWGFIFWDVKPTFWVIVGLVLVSISIWLCLTGKEKEEKKTTFKWLFFVILAFLGNAICIIVQKTEQMKFDGQHGEMLMAFASILSFVIFTIIFLVRGRKNAGPILKKSWYLPVSAGIFNILYNLFMILLAVSILSPNLIYPTVGVGNIIIVIIISQIAFKEKIKWTQWIGIALGLVATLLLSLNI